MAWPLGGANGFVEVDDTEIRVRHGVMVRATVPLRELAISLDDPDGFLAALTH